MFRVDIDWFALTFFIPHFPLLLFLLLILLPLILLISLPPIPLPMFIQLHKRDSNGNQGADSQED